MRHASSLGTQESPLEDRAGGADRPTDTEPMPGGRSSERHPLLRYGAAVALVTTVTLLRVELRGAIGEKSPYMVYLLAAMLASWCGGVGPACTALALGGLCGFFLFTNPPYSFVLGEPNDLLVITLYAAVGLILVFLHDSQRKARARAQEKARAARLHAELLTREVEQRKEAELARAQHLEEIEQLNTRLRRAMTETDHRVKNNLQVISALVDLQLMQADEFIPVADLRRLIGHIRAIALIHDHIARGRNQGTQVSGVSAYDAINNLVPLLEQIAEQRPIRVRIDDASLSVRQGTALAILVQELVSNAVKHGHGEVVVLFAVQGEGASLEVIDDGLGFPPGFDPWTASNTGLELIDSLGRWDLQGQVSFQNRPEGGGRVVVSFPLVSQAVVSARWDPQMIDRPVRT